MTPLEALAKARAAWEATQPQLTLWGELSETARGGAAVSLSPPRPRTLPPKGGLNPGPEPRCEPGADGVTPRGPTRSYLPPAGGSGPS